MQLLDQHGRPMKPTTKRELTKEISAPSMGSVRTIQAGHPADGLTPARLGMILREAETGDATAYLEMAEQMEERDLHYAAVLGVRKRAIRSLEVQVEPAGTSDHEINAAALVRDVMQSAPVRLVLIDLLDAIGKGFSVAEIIWDDPKKKEWKPKKIEHRDPRWFKFDQDTGRRLLLRSNEGDQELKPAKFISHLAKIKSGLPIRSGLARLAAWGYIFKNYTIKDWAVFMEAYGHPVRLGKYGANATREDRLTLLRAVRNIGTDMAAIIPRSMEMEIINANVTGAGPLYEASAEYWDKQLSKAVLGQVSTTDAIAGGHAVGRVHDQVRDDIRDADAEQLAMSLQRDLAGPLVAFNFGSDVAVPSLSFVAPEEHDPRLLAVAAEKFVKMGLKIPTAVVRERFAIREPEDGEDVLVLPQAQPAPEPVAASAQGEPRPNSLEEMIERIMADDIVAASADPIVAGYLEAIAGARSLREVRDLLEQLAFEAPDEALQELVAQVTFAGRMAGELGADVGGS
ncbi:MAG: DUF935 domain-containing protein [Dinoroseobacter sp.]|nr:DUF935 domain-containing protein [Dinoroseobacter sp.]